MHSETPRGLSPLFLSLTILLIASGAVSQNSRADSLANYLQSAKSDTNRINALNALAKIRVTARKDDEARKLGEEARQLSEKLGFDKGRGQASLYIGLSWAHQAEYGEALRAYDTAIAIFLKSHFHEGAGKSFQNRGNVFLDKANYPDAMKDYLSAIGEYERCNNKQGIANCKGNIGNIYNFERDYDNALLNYSESLRMLLQLGDKVNAAIRYDAIGNVWQSRLDYKKARENFLEGLRLRMEIGDSLKLTNSWTNLGNLNWYNKQYDSSLVYYEKALKVKEKSDDLRGTGLIYSCMGHAYSEKKDFEKAVACFGKSVRISELTNNPAQLKSDYNALARLYYHLKKYQMAYNYFRRYHQINDSIFNLENTRQLSAAKTRFEVEKKEAEMKAIAQAEKDKLELKSEEEKRRRNLVIYFALGGLMVVSGFSVIIWRGLQKNKKANKIISAQKEEVEEKNILIEEKQKEIFDSITYAKRLQDAILPTDSFLKSELPEHFVLYKPREIVAGDFYWMEKNTDDTVFVAASDCTGHGVPGAMVSLVCANALERASKEFALTETGQILDKTRELILSTFVKGSDVKDGMDISLLSFNKKSGTINWSGANNPLWYISDRKLVEITADKQPIGKTDHMRPFNTHQLQLARGTMVYLMTDGFADQFGGEKGKKYKYKQLSTFISEVSDLPAGIQKERLLAEFEKWKGGLEQVDDVTIIGIRF